ncbi:MAG: hypothetical protein OEZ30_06080 [Candidatus Aminicenantes bacterium]|nr:hypothetical protein [Candidatus Aminicenantes bacterium]
MGLSFALSPLARNSLLHHATRLFFIKPAQKKRIKTDERSQPFITIWFPMGFVICSFPYHSRCHWCESQPDIAHTTALALNRFPLLGAMKRYLS